MALTILQLFEFHHNTNPGHGTTFSELMKSIGDRITANLLCTLRCDFPNTIPGRKKAKSNLVVQPKHVTTRLFLLLT